MVLELKSPRCFSRLFLLPIRYNQDTIWDLKASCDIIQILMPYPRNNTRKILLQSTVQNYGMLLCGKYNVNNTFRPWVALVLSSIMQTDALHKTQQINTYIDVLRIGKLEGGKQHLRLVTLLPSTYCMNRSLRIVIKQQTIDSFGAFSKHILGRMLLSQYIDTLFDDIKFRSHYVKYA